VENPIGDTSCFSDHAITHRLHAQDADFLLDQFGQTICAKLRKCAYNQVLVGIWTVFEAEAGLGGYFQHIEMNVWLFVAGKSDVAILPLSWSREPLRGNRPSARCDGIVKP